MVDIYDRCLTMTDIYQKSNRCTCVSANIFSKEKLKQTKTDMANRN